MRPRLTIAIPTVNRADLVGRAIESALAQTCPDVEILVSDNGSTDGTPEVIGRYAGKGLRTFRHANTMSAASHGRFLIEQARGEFFLGLSDDDYLEPEFAGAVLDLFDRRPDLALVYTGCAVHYEKHAVPALVGPSVEPGLTFLAEHYGGRREVSWCACVTRVRDLRELGPQPENRIMGDMFFWTRIAFRGPAGCVPRVLSHYILLRERMDNTSHGVSPAAWTRDSRTTAEEVQAAARKAGAGTEQLLRLRRDARRYIGRSAGNQFVWCRIRGAGLIQAWSWLPSCLPSICWSAAGLIRMAAALVLPREMLRFLLLRGAEKLAESRARDASLSLNTQ